MSATLHLYVPLLCYSSLKIDPTLLHILFKRQQTATAIQHATAIHVPAINMPLICHIYVTCANYLTRNQWGMNANGKVTWELTGINQGTRSALNRSCC